MAKVRLFNGKPLLVNGKVALNDDCCCGGGGGGNGACCDGDGNCTVTTEEDCPNYWQGNDTSCDDDNQCKGGCCDFFTSTCSIKTLNECAAAFGTFLGFGSDCTGVDCTCCPFFTNYNRIRLSGTIEGCPGGTITIPEQTWLKVTYPPANEGEFAIQTCTSFVALNCSSGGTPDTFIISYETGCDTTNSLSVDFATACGPFVSFAGIATDCGSSISTDFYDLSPGSLTVIESTGGITYTWNVSVEQV